MKVIDVTYTQRPVNTKSFEVIKDDDYPVCLLGVEIKNEYDQQRFVFNKKLSSSSKDIIHFIHYPNTETKFFRGIILKPSFNITSLVKEIIKHKQIYTDNITPVMYRDILLKYNLTCDNAISHLCEGIYPIDSECLDKVSTEKYSLTEIYEMLFDNKKIPFYQSVGYLTIYILDNTNIANSTNYKALKKLVNTQKSGLAYTK